jgi:hypothetical protein
VCGPVADRGGSRGSSASSWWVAPGRHAASHGEKEESLIVSAAGIGGWSREEDVGWETPHGTGREGEGDGEGRRRVTSMPGAVAGV